jgi:hypothetical protein
VRVYLYKNFVTVFNIAVSNSDYSTSKDRMIMNTKIQTGKNGHNVI